METWDSQIVEESNEQSEISLQVFQPQANLLPYTNALKITTPYSTAISVPKPRELSDVERRVLRAAILLGDDAFYGWGSGKNRIEGGSIHLAMAMINAYGNAAIVAETVQETAEAFIFNHTFIDLEQGVSIPRQWRESKRSIVEGRMDEERKMQIRFGRGQSKNIRNTIFNAMPKYLINKAIIEAKKGIRNKIEKFISEKTLSAAQLYITSQLKRVGVTEDQILKKMDRIKIEGLTIDDIVMLSADQKSIESGNESASSLFELTRINTNITLKERVHDSVTLKKNEEEVLQ